MDLGNSVWRSFHYRPGRLGLLALTVSFGVASPAGGQATVLRSFPGAAAGDRFGHAVGSAGDVDGDGVPDLIVGAPQMLFAPSGAGYARVYSGSSGTLLLAWTGSSLGDRFGWSVAGAGDVDGDGVPDLVIGAPGVAPGGQAQVFSGVGGTILHTFAATGAGEEMGASVAGAGDSDGDGFADVAVGAPQASPGGVLAAGRATIHSGASGAILRSIAGSGVNDLLGASIAAVGDVDGDGVSDLLVGAPQNSPSTPVPGSGYARLFSGATAAVLWTAFGAGNADFFGTSVGSVGDVNGDGVPDAIVGAPEFGNVGPTGLGYARVLSGTNGSVLLSLLGPGGLPVFGISVAGVGDLDADGRPDVVAGAPASFLSLPGRVRTFSGMNGATLLEFGGSSGFDHFGASVAGAGDVDGDGVPEILAGEPGAPPGNTGRAKVVSGVPLPSGSSVSGTGCLLAGSFLPYVSTAGSPTVGNPAFGIVVSCATPIASTVLLAGLSTLSFNLGPFGVANCTLLVLPLFLFPAMANASGIATVSVPVPPDGSLVGGFAYFQWFVVGPGPALEAFTQRLAVRVLP